MELVRAFPPVTVLLAAAPAGAGWLAALLAIALFGVRQLVGALLASVPAGLAIALLSSVPSGLTIALRRCRRVVPLRSQTAAYIRLRLK